MPEVKNETSTVAGHPVAKAAKVKHLPSGKPTHHPTTLGFNVENGGVIQEKGAPARFIVSKNEIVTWVIGNTSGGPITVTLLDFKFKPLTSNEPKGSVDITPQPFIWLGSDTVALAPQQVGFLAGVLSPDYDHHNHLGFHDHLTYTIAVRSLSDPSNPQEQPNFFEDVDYDPDGEIKP
jgi:hypothetical protein